MESYAKPPTERCRGGTCPSRRRTCSPYKPPSKWQTPSICHCEAPTGPWQSREGSCVFADSFPTMWPGTVRLPRRFAPRNDTSGEREVHQRLCAVECPCTRRSLSAATFFSRAAAAATDAIGRCVFIGTLNELEVPSRDCHVASLLAMTNRGPSSF